MTPDARFQSLVETFLREPGVTRSKMFGSEGLKAGGKVFAVLVRGRLVVKLPADRVAALVASGDGEPFDPGMGRLMREWIAIAPHSVVPWPGLAEEARDFVASGPESKAKRPRR